MDFKEACLEVLKRDAWLKPDYIDKGGDRAGQGYEYLYDEAKQLLKLPPPPPPPPSTTYTPGKGDPTKEDPKMTVPSTRPIDYTSSAICCCPSCRQENK